MGQEVAEFCDDGFSGTNMDRPGLQEMLKQVKQSKISCILVKDMSRFARDYIELGDYLNQIFPFMGVRFIAVNDHYDSREHEGSTPRWILLSRRFSMTFTVRIYRSK